jgi:DNA-binding PucR family transcriptional regulator
VTFAGLETVPDKERNTLLETLGVWLDAGGSAQRASKQLFVHRNTVHQRLRKLETYTGQDLTDPRSVALVTLAYEIDRRPQQHSDPER